VWRLVLTRLCLARLGGTRSVVVVVVVEGTIVVVVERMVVVVGSTPVERMVVVVVGAKDAALFVVANFLPLNTLTHRATRSAITKVLRIARFSKMVILG
jgi:hypothetical protein